MDRRILHVAVTCVCVCGEGEGEAGVSNLPLGVVSLSRRWYAAFKLSQLLTIFARSCFTVDVSFSGNTNLLLQKGQMCRT